MAVEELDGHRARSSFVRYFAPWLLIIPSALIGLLLVELSCRLFFPSIGSIKGLSLAIFFDSNTPIFRNHDGIFNYFPHSEIRNVTVFMSKDDFRTEYDYHFKTNNYGLVQDDDVAPERKSLLLLGDSFTEGQGAEPWFRTISPEIEKLGYQPVNGGVLGTGFEQWLKLTQYLAAQDVQIRKLVVIFISDDFHRSIWNIQPDVLQCLLDPPLCSVENSYFYRLPPPEEMSSWISRIRTARGPLRTRSIFSVSAVLPASYSVYNFLNQQISFARAEKQSRDAIEQLLRIYGPRNVAFLHLPEKEEIDHGPDDLGLRAQNAIQKAGGQLFDGFKLCQLTKADYYLHDEHPNKNGYRKIATCVAGVASQFIEKTQ